MTEMHGGLARATAPTLVLLRDSAKYFAQRPASPLTRGKTRASKPHCAPYSSLRVLPTKLVADEIKVATQNLPLHFLPRENFKKFAQNILGRSAPPDCMLLFTPLSQNRRSREIAVRPLQCTLL
jgi:hypothetical protein